jgi:hypothetical protein
MLTDAPPRKSNRYQFAESDRIKTLDLPNDSKQLRDTRSLQTLAEKLLGRLLQKPGVRYGLVLCGVSHLLIYDAYHTITTQA